MAQKKDQVQQTRKAFLFQVFVMLNAVASNALAADELMAGDQRQHILAFGDSLTQGLYGGYMFHPYKLELQSLLDKNNVSAQVTEMGLSGERVVNHMQERLLSSFHSAAGSGIQYSWVLLLGGINDLGYNRSPGSVFDGLKAMYTMAHRHGAKVLAMTLMETKLPLNSEHDLSRQAVNSYIRNRVQQAEHAARMLLLDLDKLIPYHTITEQQREELWDDGLHLKPAGYDLMGRLVFEALQGQLTTG